MGLGSRLAGYFSLSGETNKVKTGDEDTQVGVISAYLPQLELSMKDDELIKLAKTWEEEWKKVYEGEKNLKARQIRAEKYWLGKGSDDVEDFLEGNDSKPKADNLIFEALETFLPIATKQNPEPIVTADDSKEGLKLSEKIKKILVYQAGMNRTNLRIQVKNAVRHWSIYFLGCAKIGWNEYEDDIDLDIIRPQKLILDPDAYFKNGEYAGDRIGEIKRDSAENLIARFPSKKKYIKEYAQGKLGTKINYQEWWTKEYTFWRLENEILDKIKNPHWNYDEEVENPVMTIDENGDDIQDRDEEGNLLYNKEKVPGANHFCYPKMPYIFLSIFNLGNQPFDSTSLIEQNIGNQDKIDKRNKQIDENVENMNSGWIVSREKAGLTDAQAQRAVRTLMKGGVTVIPSGTPRQAIDRVTGVSLPADVYNERQDTRNELRGIFGVTGLQPQSIMPEKTVGGKIMVKGSDIDRIGGGIADYIELFTSKIYDWMVQMIYVYYGVEKTIPVIGRDGTQELISIKNSDIDRKLVINVKEGSLVPKDSLTKQSMAVDLWSAGALDPLTLYETLEYPDPKDMVKKLINWKMNPMSLVENDMGASAFVETENIPEEQQGLTMPLNTNIEQYAPQI